MALPYGGRESHRRRRDRRRGVFAQPSRPACRQLLGHPSNKLPDRPVRTGQRYAGVPEKRELNSKPEAVVAASSRRHQVQVVSGQRVAASHVVGIRRHVEQSRTLVLCQQLPSSHARLLVQKRSSTIVDTCQLRDVFYGRVSGMSWPVGVTVHRTDVWGTP